MVQDGSVAACASQPALPCRGVGVGTCNQSLIFEKIINRVRPNPSTYFDFMVSVGCF